MFYNESGFRVLFMTQKKILKLILHIYVFALLVQGASYPRYKKGPDGEHLLVARVPWFTGCVTVQYLIEPGYDYEQEGATKDDTGGAACTTSCFVTAVLAAAFLSKIISLYLS